MGVGLAFMLVASLMAFMAPVAAQDYEENEWKEWGLPSVEEDTDIGPMAIAPDGTIFAAILDLDGDDDGDIEDNTDDIWKVCMSDDGGFSWDDTDLDDIGDAVAQIVVSPNYDEDETVYVGVFGTDSLAPEVWRLEEAGDDAKQLKTIVDSGANPATELYSLDAWYSDKLDYNLILVGTDVDVLLLEDMVTGFWIDQELDMPAYEVNFAPDFEDEELIWAISEIWNVGDAQYNFLVTSTIAPGQWGQEIGDVELDDVEANPWVDLDFPDDYSSDVDEEVPTLFAAISSEDGAAGEEGGVWLIEGIEAGEDSVATQLMDDENIVSIAVSDDASDAFILAGGLNTPTMYYSDDGGSSWDEVDKNPTGWYDFDAPNYSGYGPTLVGPDYLGGRFSDFEPTFSWTEVLMEEDVVWGGEVFDPDDGVAYAGTHGFESGISRSTDGGMVWNQIGLVDTYLTYIEWLGFHPDFPSGPTFMMITYSDGFFGTNSLWLTENGDEEEPDYMRVLCGYPGGAPGNHDGWFDLVDYSWDGDAIYITGEDDDGDEATWKSTDDGQTFGSQRKVKDDANIYDWEIPDSKTIYAATDQDGFYMTINSGLSWTSTDVGDTCGDIALSPDFEDDETILLGSDDGQVYMSDDAGDAFDDTGLQLYDDEVYVAFDADYADEDADGYMLIYAGGEDDDIQVGEVTDTDEVDWEDLDQDEGTDIDQYASCEGLVVAEDNALYAIDNDNASQPAGNDVGLDRLLLHEDDSEWEFAGEDDLDSPDGLWVTSGTDANVLWTIDDDDAELWVLEDTLSGKVTLDSPPDGYQHDREDVIQLAWDEMRGADEYEYSGDETSGLGTDIGPDTTDDTDVNVEVDGSSEYDWKVRVAPMSADSDTWHSRWSDEWTFNTALGAPPWAPELFAPGNGDTDVPLMPAFAWETAKTADSYQFQLNDSPDFATLVDVKVSTEAYQIDFDLEYDTTYYWRVKAYKGTKAISRWSEVSVFTTMAEPGAPPPPPPPPATVTQPAPAPIIMPTPIPPVLLWVIVGIGAALIVAVIVLIVRTRRAV